MIEIEDHYEAVELAMAMISVQELYSGKSTLREDEEKRVKKVLDLYRQMPYTKEAAVLAGSLVRDGQIGTDFADSAIAAIAIINYATLATLNQKDFKNVKGLRLLDLKKL